MRARRGLGTTLCRVRSATVVGAVALTASGCDMAVVNPNEPDRERALADALAVESLVSGTFQTWWEHAQGAAPSRFYSSAASVLSASALNYGNFDAGFLPRKPLINQPGYQWGYSIEDPWMFMYRSLASIRDGLLMVQGGLQIGAAGADTRRLRAFGRFMQGLQLGFIAEMYDQGYILDETVDPAALVREKQLKPYKEVMAKALTYFAEARTLAGQGAFTIPAGWMGTRTYTNQDLIRLTHSYEARYLSAVARTPAERAAVDWNRVLGHIQQGVTADFGIEMDGPGGIWSKSSGLKAASTSTGALNIRFLGPADQSGAWRAWEATEPRARAPIWVETDDRRIHAAGNPRAAGTLIDLTGQIHNDPQRGAWFQSPYSTFAWRTIANTNRGFAPDLTVEEMDFLRAEAYIRLDRAAEALPVINKTRVENGRLPAATVAGVSGSRCVPRTITGACGNLMQALIYEKSLETLWLSAGLDFFDARGWGTLVPGTFLHVPVPALELATLGMPVYTFGAGAGGAAP
jgi:hypothetical protein